MRRSHAYRATATKQFWRGVPKAVPVLVPSGGQPSSAPVEDEIAALRREKREFHEQLFEAAQVQRKLSGPRLLRLGNLQIASETFAARYLSGDFIITWDHGSKVIVAIGDVAGKGLSAGMWFTHLVGLIHRQVALASDSAQIVAEVNRHLCCLKPGAPVVTMFLAEIDSYSGEMVYCNAGHFPPLVLRDSGSTKLLTEGGPLLGALHDARFEIGQEKLEPGDRLLAYSDGVVECRNSAGEEFGLQALVAHARRAEQPTAPGTLLAFLACVQDFANGVQLCDDLSVMVVQRDATGQEN